MKNEQTYLFRGYTGGLWQKIARQLACKEKFSFFCHLDGVFNYVSADNTITVKFFAGDT